MTRSPAEERRQRRDGAAIAEAAERDDRGEPDVGVLRVQLLDQQIDDAGVLPDDRLDDVGADRGLAEQAGQRLFDRRSAQPAEHRDERRSRSAGAARRPRRAAAARRRAASAAWNSVVT